MDVDLRELRLFVVVAEELHFSRAAARVHLDQPTLSRRIRRLEESIGVELFTRTTRSVALTVAGEAFLDKARAALETAEEAVEAAQQAAAGYAGTLRVGMMAQVAADLRTIAFQTFEERYPQIDLRPTSFPFADPSCGLASGETDAAFVWLPLPHPSIETELLFEEPRLFVLASDHPLARKSMISLEDVEDEAFFTLAGMADDPLAAAWNDFWQLQPRPDGRRRPTGIEVATEQEWLDGLTRGRAISTTALSAEQFYPWPGITYVEAAGIEPAEVAIAWRKDRPKPIVANFVEIVRALRDKSRAGLRLGTGLFATFAAPLLDLDFGAGLF
jgi:DNA-binding transcriptional LysR family regulator